MSGTKVTNNPEIDTLVAPDMRTVRLFEVEGHLCRIFMTAAGTIACEKHDPASGAWRHIPLRKAAPLELFDMFVIRRGSPDQEIARALASY